MIEWILCWFGGPLFLAVFIAVVFEAHTLISYFLERD